MSSARGSTNRRRPQKHQNRTAFKNDLHDTSHKTKLLNSLEINGVCQRCKDILDWKIKYKKYKPLTAPRKCVGCEQKNVKHAYHMLCSNCAKEKKVCAKCLKSSSDVDTDKPEKTQDSNDIDIKQLLKELPERRRRTILRYLNKHQEGNGQNISPEMLSKVEDMIEKMDSMSFDDDDFENGEYSCSDEDSEEN